MRLPKLSLPDLSIARFSLPSWSVYAVIAALMLSGIGVLAYTQLRPGPRELPCVEHRFEDESFVVCSYDARRHDLRLVAKGADGEYLRSLRALSASLGQDAARVRFAMNAGMFDNAGAPIGLYVEDGRELHRVSRTDGPGNFHLKPNGVFSVDADGAVRVEETNAYVAREGAPLWATQSGPMLVIGGALHPAIKHDGVSRLVRNGVGVRDGRTAFFVISERAVSFGKLARFFRDELGCNDALFLDGTVSSLWAPQLGRIDNGPRIGPMVVVMERK